MKKKVILPLLAVLTLGACAGTDGDSSMGSSLGQSSSTSQSVSSSFESSLEESSSKDSSLEETSVEESASSEESSSSQEEETSSQTSDSSVTSDIEPESYKVILPDEIDGIEIEASSLKPAANEEVRLFVKNTVQESKRVDEIKMNDTILEGYHSTEANVAIYKFNMPTDSDAVIAAKVVDVYAIKIDDEVKDYLTLDYSITPRVAAEGETVQFKVASFAGYWFKYVTLVENDVILSEQDGIYSFTMPAHAVTITATTGTKVFKVNLKTGDDEADDAQYYRFVGLQDEQAFVYGSMVRFTVESTNPDIKITKVLLDGQELTLTDEAVEYSFSMPAYDVNLSAEWDTEYRNVVGKNSDHFKVNLTTEFAGQEIPVDNNVLLGQRVYVATEELTDEPNKFVVDGFKFSAGDDTENLTTVTINMAYADGRSYFEMPETYKYIEVTPVEKEVMFKNSPYVGTYAVNSIFRTYWTNGGGSPLTLTQEGQFKGKQLIADVNDPNHFSTSTNEQLFLHDDQFILYYEGSGAGQSYLAAKDAGEVDYSSKEKTYSIHVKIDSSSGSGQFIQATFGETVMTAYVDYVAQKVYWEAEAVLIKGVDGFTKDDLVGIKAADAGEDEYLAAVKITNEHSGKTDGYLRDAEPITFEEEKTYHGALGDLVFDKFGTITLDGEAVTAVQEEEQLTITKGSTTIKVTLNDADSSYEVTYNSDTDDFSAVVNTWVSESDPAANNLPVTLTIDDTGKAILNATGEEVQAQWQNVEFQFVSRANNVYTFNNVTYGDLVVTLNDDSKSITFVYTQGGADGSTSYTIYKSETLDLVGHKYSGSFFDSDDSSVAFAVSFIDGEKCTFDIYTRTDMNASYVISEDGKTITVNANANGTFDLIVQDDGRLLVDNFSASTFYSFYTSYIEGTYLTLAN